MDVCFSVKPRYLIQVIVHFKNYWRIDKRKVNTQKLKECRVRDRKK